MEVVQYRSQMTPKQEIVTILPDHPELILEVPTRKCGKDDVDKLVIPFELAKKTPLIEAIKSQNNEKVNQALTTLLQCIDVNRLLAVRRVIKQLWSVGFLVSSAHQNELATHFSSHATQIIANFQNDYSCLDQISPNAIDRLIDKLVVLLSIYYVICLLGFAEFTTYSNLLDYCVTSFDRILQSSSSDVQTEILRSQISKKVEELTVTP